MAKPSAAKKPTTRKRGAAAAKGGTLTAPKVTKDSRVSKKENKTSTERVNVTPPSSNLRRHDQPKPAKAKPSSRRVAGSKDKGITKKKGIRAGEWPCGGPFNKKSGVIISEPPADRTVKEAIAERMNVLKTILNGKYDLPKTHRLNVRAALTAYERSPNTMKEPTFWIDGRRVSKQDAIGKQAWIETFGFDETELSALILPGRSSFLLDYEIESGVFEIPSTLASFPLHPMEASGAIKRPRRYDMNILLQYRPEDREHNGKPFPQAPENTAVSDEEYHLNCGRALITAKHDTGAGMLFLCPQAARDLETYYDYKGWETAGHAGTAGGVALLSWYRIANFSHVHWGTGQAMHPFQAAFIACPADYKSNLRSAATNLAGLTVLNDMHFMKVKGEGRDNGLIHSSTSRMFQCNNFEPDYVNVHVNQLRN